MDRSNKLHVMVKSLIKHEKESKSRRNSNMYLKSVYVCMLAVILDFIDYIVTYFWHISFGNSELK